LASAKIAMLGIECFAIPLLMTEAVASPITPAARLAVETSMQIFEPITELDVGKQKIKIGMTQEQIIQIIGKPGSIEQIMNGAKPAVRLAYVLSGRLISLILQCDSKNQLVLVKIDFVSD
jgi:hypothetical protein